MLRAPDAQRELFERDFGRCRTVGTGSARYPTIVICLSIKLPIKRKAATSITIELPLAGVTDLIRAGKNPTAALVAPGSGVQHPIRLPTGMYDGLQILANRQVVTGVREAFIPASHLHVGIRPA